MCGIVGTLDLQRRAADPALLRRLCNRMSHRGPDDEGYHIDRFAGIGQRRLSIIDLMGGIQPMANEDGSVWLTFNGEVYNFQALRDRLRALGHRFATDSDTEVVVHAWEQYGPECVHHLRGMFAFAIWDAKRSTLFLARDRAGKKPLYYTHASGRFLFASELQALVEDPDVSREIDIVSLDDYLTYGYVPAPRTIFEGVHKLPPAHTLLLQLRDNAAPHITVQRYWQLEYAPKLELSEEDAADELLRILKEAVRLRMIADVPLGALLSGGIDSSIVVALMSGLSDRPVKTFSIGFADRAFNELPYARLVAQRYGTDHHELVVEPRALEVLPMLVRHYGEPFADSSAIPSYYVARLTREHVKVALNGDGGDESFAGYERYFGSQLAERYRALPAALRRGAIEPLSRLVPHRLHPRNRLRQARRFLEVAAQPAAQRYARWVSVIPHELKQQLYSPEMRQRMAEHDRAPYEYLTQQFEALADRDLDPVDHLLALDVQTYLPGDLLVKMDIASMAASLEARSPFLDHEVMGYAARLPSSYKLKGGRHKHLLKRIGADLLPPELLARRKMGFGVPVGEWIRGELRPLLEDTLLSQSARSREWFDHTAVRNLVDRHVRGGENHAFSLWALIWLELWQREFVDKQDTHLATECMAS